MTAAAEVHVTAKGPMGGQSSPKTQGLQTARGSMRGKGGKGPQKQRSSVWNLTPKSAIPRAGGGVSASEAFSLLGSLLYNRFKKEMEIDKRRLKAFRDRIGGAQPLTNVERAMVDSMLRTRGEVDENARRIAGTSAEELFTNLWVLPTYANLKFHRKDNGALPRTVWENVDGNRSLQYGVTIRFPTGFKNRYFETTIT